MAELCKKCFIEIWHPNAYEIEHIVMSKNNDFCESCMDCVSYVDHIDVSRLIHVPTADDFKCTVANELEVGHTIACPECGAIFEDDDIPFTYETGLCQHCYATIKNIWIADKK